MRILRISHAPICTIDQSHDPQVENLQHTNRAQNVRAGNAMHSSLRTTVGELSQHSCHLVYQVPRLERCPELRQSRRQSPNPPHVQEIISGLCCAVVAAKPSNFGIFWVSHPLHKEVEHTSDLSLCNPRRCSGTQFPPLVCHRSCNKENNDKCLNDGTTRIWSRATPAALVNQKKKQGGDLNPCCQQTRTR